MQRLNYKTFVYILSFAHFQENSGQCVLFEMTDEKRQNVFRAFCADRICFVVSLFLMLIYSFLKKFGVSLLQFCFFTRMDIFK